MIGRVIGSSGWAYLLSLCCCALAWAAGGPSASPVVPAPATETVVDGAARSTPVEESSAHAASLAVPRSALDSEPIRRNGVDSGSVSAPISQPQGMELPRVAGALAIVIGLIFALRWGGKKLLNTGGTLRSTRVVQVLSRQMISPRQHIALLRVGRRIILIGESGAQMSTLAEITDADEIASLLGQLQDEKTRIPQKAFNALFKRARQGMGSHEADLSGADTEAESEPDVSESGQQAADETPSDPAMAQTRSELSGLMEKVRLMSRHFRSGPA